LIPAIIEPLKPSSVYHHEVRRGRRGRRGHPRRAGLGRYVAAGRFPPQRSQIANEEPRPGFGHVTVAYIATNLVAPETAAFMQDVLGNKTGDYLAGVATWADSVRYTKWGRFTATFHFIDAKDRPPGSCDVDLARDCKASGCVVTSVANYTAQLLDGALPAVRREQAAKFVVHFLGDIHQPLHAEDVLRGGNGIKVAWGGRELNLHHVWDSSIAEKLFSVRSRYYEDARRTARELTDAITAGKFKAAAASWTAGMNFSDPTATALYWARESNAYVCSHGEVPLGRGGDSC